MQTSSIALGHRAKDRITGFVGVVVGIVDYISGCNQALLVPPVDPDGKLRTGEWFDVQRLELLQDEKIVLDNGDTPGADANPNRNY